MDEDSFEKTFSEKAESFINQYFGSEFWSGFEKSKPGPVPKQEYPKIDLLEKENEVVAVIELPGLRDPGDVEVTANNTSLTIKGKMFCQAAPPGAQCHICEFGEGSFSREISLPAAIDINSLRASYRWGILEVRMNKKLPATELEFNFE